MIDIYFSDTEAVKACICRLNMMWCDELSGSRISYIRDAPTDVRYGHDARTTTDG